MRSKKYICRNAASQCTRWAPQAVLTALLVLAWTQSSARENAGDWQRLRAGEILVQTIHEEKSGGAARVTGLFHADAETIWNVLGYCKNEFVYVRGLEVCEVLVPGLQYIKKHHRVKNNWFTPTLDFVFEARRASATHGDFKLVEGDLKVMEGQWDFQPAADGEGLLVRHDIRIQSKLPAPRWLVRRVLKKDLPDMLACVRGMAGASGNKDLLAGDLDRCPGDIAGVGK